MLLNWYNKFDPKNENIELLKKEGWIIINQIEKYEGNNAMSSKEAANMQPLSYFQDILKSYDLNKVLVDKAHFFQISITSLCYFTAPD